MKPVDLARLFEEVISWSAADSEASCNGCSSRGPVAQGYDRNGQKMLRWACASCRAALARMRS